MEELSFIKTLCELFSHSLWGFLRTWIDQGECLTILRRTYQTASSRNRLWHSPIPDLSTAILQPLWRPFQQPNRVSDGVSIRPVQSDEKTIAPNAFLQRGSHQVVLELRLFLVEIYLTCSCLWFFIIRSCLVLEFFSLFLNRQWISSVCICFYLHQV